MLKVFPRISTETVKLDINNSRRNLPAELAKYISNVDKDSGKDLENFNDWHLDKFCEKRTQNFSG
jgi:hypothetical protein